MGGVDLIPWPKVDFTKFGPIEAKPLARIKKIYGANLHRNWVMIPHVTNHDDADITDLEQFRVQLNKENEKSGVRVSMLAFMIKVAVATLKKFPDFNASLEDPIVHQIEHVIFLVGALLFWWPAVALDPAPYRMSHPARIGYLFTQMTQNTFLAVVILNANEVLYPHYATLVRPWGMTALEDQRLAAGIMWIAGDAIFLTAILAVLAGWMRAEARNEAREDRRADAELARIRVRERALAERLAEERTESGS